MIENHESRVLRFEPLESRSLLAGDLFAGDHPALDLFADNILSRGSQPNVQAIQTQDVRTAGNDNGRNFQRPDRPNPPNFDRGPIQNSRVIFIPQTPIPLAPIQEQPSQPSRAVELTNRLSLSAVDVAVSATTAGDSDATVVGNLTSAVTGDSSHRPLQNPKSEFEFAPPQLAPLTHDVEAIHLESKGGLIELSPLNLDLSLDEPLDNSQLPWQLDTELFPHIQSVIQHASNRPADVTDVELATRFAGQVGMIAVDQVVLPTSPIIAAVDWLDVQLEATLKLHRSLELIASGKATPLSDVALDAIMTSLADVAESESQPINSLQSYELPKLAYPVIAVLSAAAIASRRKHKQPDPLTECS